MYCKKSFSKWNAVKQFWFLYILLIPIALYIVILRFYPIMLQIVLSFKEYNLSKGIWGSPWVGWKNFIEIFSSSDIGRIIFNTVNISLLKLAFGFFPPILLAIMLYDLKFACFRKITQNLLYIPHFFSWVIIYAVSFAMFSNSGIINGVLMQLGIGGKEFLLDQKYFLPILVGTDIWKEVGWNTILYTAALSSINTEICEAAKIDGAGPLKRIRYILIPEIIPIIVFVLTLSLGNILKGAGTEQILLFYTPATYSIGDVIDTWIYRQGLGRLQYSLAASVSLFQSVFGFILVLGANKLSNKYAKIGIW